jgi:hypothetical protein
MGPLMREMFSATGKEPSLDLNQIIQNGETLLVPLEQDSFFSSDQKTFVAAQMLHDLVETIIETPRELRKPFVIIIDEAAEMMAACGERLNRSLGLLRKYMGGGGVIIGGQDLSTFRITDKIDLTPKLLSQCGLLCCFNQRWPEDLNVLAPVLFAKNFKFDKLIQQTERHTGEHDWIPVEEHSKQWNKQKRVSHGLTLTETETITESETSTKARMHSEGNMDSIQGSMGNVHTNSRPLDNDTRKIQLSDAQSNTAGFGKGRTITDGDTESNATGKSRALGTATGKSYQEGDALGEGGGISYKQIPLPKPPVLEDVDTGMLKDSFNDQLERFKQWIACLTNRRMLVKIHEGEAFEVLTAEVPDAFSSMEAQVKCVEWVKDKLYRFHPYFFTPRMDEDDRERRLGIGEVDPIVNRIEKEENHYGN